MVGAIEEITINQGIDPQSATLVGGGGAAGLNAVAVGRRLGCEAVLIPETGAALSAAGALMSELSSEYARLMFTTSDRFDREGVNRLLADLTAQCEAFIAGPGEGSLASTIEFAVEARYPHQIWEIEVPLRTGRFASDEDLAALVGDFHEAHRALFEISDPKSGIELVTWRARVRCRLREQAAGRLGTSASSHATASHRKVYFAESGWVDAQVERFETMPSERAVAGPAIIESSFTTVVVDPGTVATRSAGGGLVVRF
jgi:N-methylhydantoinase A